VAGLSLLSSSIMRLEQPSTEGEETSNASGGHVDLLLPPLSLYVLTDVSRYEYAHELLPCGAIFKSRDDGDVSVVQRGRRLSIIFRDAKKKDDVTQ